MKGRNSPAAHQAAIPVRGDVEAALERARQFIARSQLPNGELPLDFHSTPAADPGVSAGERSPSVFGTMYACLALRADTSMESRAIIERARPFLWSQQVPPGLWKYFAPGRIHPRHMPADIDTTSGMLSLARAMGWLAPSSRWMVAQQRRGDGRFYTWFAPGIVRTRSPRYWWYLLRDLTIGRFFFFRRFSARARDIDLVVNAHVVGYLGDCDATRGAMSWIVDVVERGAEENNDKWYHDRSACYLALARACSDGVGRFREMLPIIESRIAERAQPDGSIAGRAISTALCASALLHFGVRGDLVNRAISWLCATQDSEGAWPAGAHFWGGPDDAWWFGSRTYTTALAVEALALYARTLDA